MESHVDDLKLISELYAAVENLERENVNVMQRNICEQHNQCLTGYAAVGMTFPTTVLGKVVFLVILSSEVIFVTPVTAGGSVRFLPVV